MKVNMLAGVMLAVTFQLLSASPSSGQTIYDTSVELEFREVTLKEALFKLQSATGYSVFFPSEKITAQMRVDLKKEARSIAQTLDILLKDTGLGYKANKENIVLFVLPEPKPDAGATQPFLKVSGIITDEDGTPLPGVSVMISNWNQLQVDYPTSTASDHHGHFSIQVPNQEAVLIFSLLGYTTQQRKIEEDRQLRIVLSTDAETLADVMVTGYQSISKERSTGSYVTLTASDLENKRLYDLEALLEGEIPGYSNGLIRGTTSMNGMTSPLFVIDGFPVEHTRYNAQGGIIESLPDLTLEDIESITVLKDAAAASIYGARAANGVVVITTKRAKQGAATVTFSSHFTLSPYRFYTARLTDASDIVELEKEWAAQNPHLQGSGAAAYAQSLKENAVYTSSGMRALLDFYSGSIPEETLGQTLNELSARHYQYYRDVERYAKQDAISQQYYLGLGKASERNRFNASMRYNRDRLEDVSARNQGFALSLKNTTDITSWLTAELGTTLHFGRSQNQTFDILNPGFAVMPYDQLMTSGNIPFTSRAEDRLRLNTRRILEEYGMYSMDITPLDELAWNTGHSRNFNNRSYGKLNLEFNDWLNYQVMFQYETSTDRFNQLSDKQAYSVRSLVNGLASYDPQQGLTYNLPYGDINYQQVQFHTAYNFRQQLDFDKTFRQRHNLTAILGSETRHARIEYQHQRRYGYDPDMLSSTPIDARSLANVSTLLGGRFSDRDMSYEREMVNRFVSFYGNAAYSLDSRYTLSGSLRWDRSNLWGTNSKYQNKPLWSLGAAWNLGQEPFMQASWINRLKLRASYGIGGNIAKDSAPYMTAFYSSNTTVGGTQGTISSRPNPLLSWEKTTTANVGLDFSLFHQRLNGALDIYNKQGRDLLANTMGVPTEGFGYSTYSINNGRMRNRGFELSLDLEAVKTSDFSWHTGLIYGYNKNKVTYVNVEAPVYFLQLDYPEAYPRIGNPYNAIYGYSWAGLNEKGQPQVYDELGEKVTSQPQTLEAIQYLGSAVPVHSGSIRNAFNYKNFRLSFQILFQLGHKLRNTDLPILNSVWSGAAGSYITQIAPVNKAITQRWKQPGDEAHTDIPRAVFAESPDYLYDSYGIYSNASIQVLDASFLRLNNVALSYRFGKSVLDQVRIKGARLQVNVENAATFAFQKRAKYMLGGYQTPRFVAGIYVDF